MSKYQQSEKNDHKQQHSGQQTKKLVKRQNNNKKVPKNIKTDKNQSNELKKIKKWENYHTYEKSKNMVTQVCNLSHFYKKKECFSSIFRRSNENLIIDVFVVFQFFSFIFYVFLPKFRSKNNFWIFFFSKMFSFDLLPSSGRKNYNLNIDFGFFSEKVNDAVLESNLVFWAFAKTKKAKNSKN